MKLRLSDLTHALHLGRLPHRFVTFFATSLAARGVGIVCQLLQVPLVVAALGSEAFGLWMTMTSVTNLMQFADFGLGIGAQSLRYLVCSESPVQHSGVIPWFTLAEKSRRQRGP